MSAFVVEPKTINRILFVLREKIKRSEWLGRMASEKLQEIEWDIESQEGAADLGQAMYNLNKNAVSQRYPTDETEDDLPGAYGDNGKLLPYRFRLEPCTDVQGLKSLQCWHYQCAEGNVPEHALYKVFDRLGLYLAKHIVDRSPQYDKAEWA